MRYAIAFIKSGGTLFPTPTPHAVANFPECRFRPNDNFARARDHRKCCGFRCLELRQPVMVGTDSGV